jgi:hypothetical protein
MFCHALYNHHRQSLARYPGNYLEIGVYNGDAIAQLAREYPNKTIIGVDPFIEDGYTSWTSGQGEGQRLNRQKTNTYNNIKDLTNIEFHEMTSRQYYDNLTDDQAARSSVSVVMIDGDHHYDNVKIDMLIALRLIGDKAGEVSFDDVSGDDVNQVVKEFEALMAQRITSKIDTKYNSLIYTLDPA